MDEQYKDYTITIEQDEDVQSPREWDNLGRMICFHRRYNLGDEHKFYSPEELDEYLKYPGVIYLPLYLYDHSGITMNTTGFSCGWDSGQVGYIYVDKKDILKEFGGKILTKKLKEKVLKILKQEVETYDQYLTGDVWWYKITGPDDEELDSCGGFYGYDYCLEEAKGMVDYYVKEAEEMEHELDYARY